MAVINGAKSKDTVIKTVKSGLMSVLRVSLIIQPFYRLHSNEISSIQIQWMINPLSLVIAQKLIPQEVCHVNSRLPSVISDI